MRSSGNQPLSGVPSANCRVTAAYKPEHRVERRHEPVGSERYARPGINKRADVVGRCASCAADPRLRPAHVVDAVTGLEGDDDAEPCEASEIFAAQRLRVLDSRPPARPATTPLVQPLENVEDERVGPVADRVHDGLDVVRVRVHDQTLELVGIVHEQAGVAGIIAVGPEESRRARSHRAVRKELPPADATASPTVPESTSVFAVVVLHGRNPRRQLA